MSEKIEYVGERPHPTSGMRHVALFVPDFDAACHFYIELMGMAVEWQPDPDNIYLCSGNDNVALHNKHYQNIEPTSAHQAGLVPATSDNTSILTHTIIDRLSMTGILPHHLHSKIRGYFNYLNTAFDHQHPNLNNNNPLDKLHRTPHSPFSSNSTHTHTLPTSIPHNNI